MEDLEYILPQDLVCGRRSLWPVLNDVRHIFTTILKKDPTKLVNHQQQRKSRSLSPKSRNPNRSKSSTNSLNSEQLQRRSRSPKKRGNSLGTETVSSPSKGSNNSSNKRTSLSPSKSLII